MKTSPESDLRERALRLLARREHSRAELVRKLEQAGYERSDIDTLCAEFEDRNWLSDRRFAESYVADHRARAGSIKLAYDLRQRGVDETVIQAVLKQDPVSEIDRAREIWRRRFGSAPADARDKSRQIRFMQSRGFAPSIINQMFRYPDATD